jgi:hypothetical protein
MKQEIILKTLGNGHLWQKSVKLKIKNIVNGLNKRYPVTITFDQVYWIDVTAVAEMIKLLHKKYGRYTTKMVKLQPGCVSPKDQECKTDEQHIKKIITVLKYAKKIYESSRGKRRRKPKEKINVLID